MSTPYLLAYVFTTFVIGMACLGGAAVTGRDREDRLARAFLLFYLALTVMVLGGLLIGVMDLFATSGGTAATIVTYLESIVGQYAVMLTLPLFAHRVFDVRNPVRNGLVIAVVATTFVAQHFTEFIVGGVWDDRGDLFENVVLVALMAYTLATAVLGYSRVRVRGPMAGRFLILMLLSMPAVAHDVFFVQGWGLRLYPFWYCVVGLAMLATLVQRPAPTHDRIPTAWNLTRREKEVLRLVQEGHSTSEIAESLFISPNTVKTHVRGIFDKSGIRTRVALIAALAAPSNPPGPSARTNGA